MRLLKCFVFVVCCLSALSAETTQDEINESEIDGSLSENIVLYGIISELATRTRNVTPKCVADLTNIFRGINRQDMWALKVMDASGTYQSSLVWGQNAWIGSKRSCDYLNKAPPYITSADVPKLMDPRLISTVSKMEMEFKMIFSILVSPYKIDPSYYLKTTNIQRLGLCLPKSCSNEDIKILSTTFFSQRKLRFQRLYNASLEVINVRNMNIENFFSRPDVLGISAALCIVAALVVLFSFANTFVEKSHSFELKRFLKCFSIRDNIDSMYNTTSSPNSIDSINGIRSVICLWVLVFHCSYFNMYAYDNLPEVMAAGDRIETQPYLALSIYVNGFFVLSAVLLVHNFLKDERTLTEIRNNNAMQNVMLFIKKIIHRYLRLTPAFIFTVGLGHILSAYIEESSSFYIDDTFEAYCTAKTFWGSLFYTHNLFAVKDMCLSWSWYLGCDMQFYTVILFILFVYVRKHDVIASALFAALFATLTALDIYLNLDMNLLPSLDSQSYHSDEFFIEPWNRMHPYLAGCTVGYIMFRMKGKKLPDNRYITISYWIATSAIFFGTLFIMWFKEVSALNYALALSFGRYFMGLFVGSWILMCHYGYGGIVNKILSLRLFVHTNKLTYIIYLIHPIFIILFSSTQESTPHFDFSSLSITILGITLLSYAAAVILSPIIEMPFQKLSDEYVIKKSKTRS